MQVEMLKVIVALYFMGNIRGPAETILLEGVQTPFQAEKKYFQALAKITGFRTTGPKYVVVTKQDFSSRHLAQERSMNVAMAEQ